MEGLDGMENLQILYKITPQQSTFYGVKVQEFESGGIINVLNASVLTPTCAGFKDSQYSKSKKSCQGWVLYRTNIKK